MRAVGLDGPDVARDHGDVESVQKVVLRAGESELVGREIAERMDRPAGGLQAPQQRDILVDRAVEGLDPPLVEEAQFAGKLGKGLGPRLDRGGEVGRGVGMGDEIHRERGCEKALHPRLVVERLAVEIARIPAQQHVADVEDDDHGSVLKLTGSNAAGRASWNRPWSGAVISFAPAPCATGLP